MKANISIRHSLFRIRRLFLCNSYQYQDRHDMDIYLIIAIFGTVFFTKKSRRQGIVHNQYPVRLKFLEVISKPIQGPTGPPRDLLKPGFLTLGPPRVVVLK